MAAIPVICAFIGTSRLAGILAMALSEVILVTGLALAVLFTKRYTGWGRGDGAGHLVDGAITRSVRHLRTAWSSAGYVATPLF